MGHALKIEGGRGWQQAVQEIKENRWARRGLGRGKEKDLAQGGNLFIFKSFIKKQTQLNLI
jgi:hypothetical protein